MSADANAPRGVTGVRRSPLGVASARADRLSRPRACRRAARAVRRAEPRRAVAGVGAARPRGAPGRSARGDRRGTADADREGRADRRGGCRDAVPDRAGPRLPRLPRQEARMVLRTAALYGRDPRDARDRRRRCWRCAACTRRSTPPARPCSRSATRRCPEKPAERRPRRTWVRSIYVLLIFGGFLSAPSDKREEGRPSVVEDRARGPGRRRGLGDHLGVPLSFMIAMAWGCESHARQPRAARAALLRRRRRQRASRDRRRRGAQGRRPRSARSLRATLLVLSIAIPIGFIAYADHVRQSTGITWLAALGALVALSLVIAASVLASRR